MAADQNERGRILVVDDDETVAEALADVLELAGYRVHHARTGAEARALLDDAHPRLIILDLILPDVDGLVLCTVLKAQAPVPILVCSATSRRRDAILSLKLGADDFVTKPFNADDLLARVEAILRRTPAARSATPPAPPLAAEELRLGSLLIENARRRVVLGDQQIPLTPTEYRLLAALAGRPDEILSRDELANQVWGYADASHGRTIDVHVRRLRVKLGQAGANTAAPTIVSVRGYGYKLVPEASATTAA
jgi:DNA-binding response OmpR family regulator